jgi:hypothetical protein
MSSFGDRSPDYGREKDSDVGLTLRRGLVLQIAGKEVMDGIMR